MQRLKPQSEVGVKVSGAYRSLYGMIVLKNTHLVFPVKLARNMAAINYDANRCRVQVPAHLDLT